MTHEEKQIHNAVHAELKEFEEFKELVKRMREAQKKIKDYSSLRIEKDRCQWENDLDNKAYLESEVDEYLKKMEI